MFDTPDQIVSRVARIRERAVVTQTMRHQNAHYRRGARHPRSVNQPVASLANVRLVILKERSDCGIAFRQVQLRWRDSDPSLRSG
jgi:hypothetical protein